MTTPATVRYRERLTVPVLWWVLGVLFAASLLVAFGFYLGARWGAGAGLVGLVGAWTVFASAATTISVEDDRLRVGRAVLELSYVAGVAALDPEQTRRRRGPGADARAHLVLRPYVPGAVEVALDDPDDPVPYWLLSSRRPRALAGALSDALAASGRPGPVPAAPSPGH